MAVAAITLVVGVALLLLLTATALDTLSGARAYIAGEGQWSKAEKRAVAHLVRYARTRHDGDYEAFLHNIAVPLGDRRAREELLKPEPDMAVVREGFLAGLNHPDDIDRMARFFIRFRNVPRVAVALEIWAEGDAEIDVLLASGLQLRSWVAAGSADPATLERLLDRIETSAARLNELERAFADRMGEAARWAHSLLFLIVGLSSVFIVIFAAVVVRSASRRTVASEISARRSEEQKRTVLDTIDDGYYDIDLEGKFTFANAGLSRMLGRPLHEVVGHHLREFVDPGSTAQALNALTHIRNTGEVVRSVSLLVRRGDGRRRIVEASVSPIRDAAGTVVGFSGLARDITERREQEEALRRSESEYRALFEHAPYGIYRSTPDGTLLAVNSALVTILGYESADQLLAASLPKDIYASAEERARLLEEHLDRDVIAEIEVEWRRRDGGPVLIRMNGRRIRDEDFDGFEMFVEDLTHRRGLEVQLRQAQKMQAVGQLTGGIAHDFNNLLTIIAATADILAEDLSLQSEGARADIAELRAAADRGAEMVRKLLAFSRRGQLRFAPTDLGSVVRETVTMLRRILPAHIEIIVDVPADAPVARADRGALEQILLNVATNARDAMPEGGTLRLEVSTSALDAGFCASHGGGRPGVYTSIAVTDTGSGMDALTLERAFEPFFTTKPPGAGTGLGMAMIYGLVRQHEGFVTLESEPGNGTTLRIHIPASVQPIAALAGDAPAERPRGNETILLVEDEAAILDTGRRILERHGYTVLTASNGEEALRIMLERRSGIDLVLSDVVMPRMGGGVLHRQARAAGCTVPFLFTSGYTEREVGGMLDPHVPLLPKPWSVDDLVRRVRNALDAPAEATTAAHARSA